MDQLVDKGDDLVHRLGDSRSHIQRYDVQRIAHIIVSLDISFSDLLLADTFFQSLVDDLVIDISKVGNEFHFIAQCFKSPPERIKDDDRTGVADMRMIVDGRSADIHADFVLSDRYEFFGLQCIAVI